MSPATSAAISTCRPRWASDCSPTSHWAAMATSITDRSKVPPWACSPVSSPTRSSAISRASPTWTCPTSPATWTNSWAPRSCPTPAPICCAWDRRRRLRHLYGVIERHIDLGGFSRLNGNGTRLAWCRTVDSQVTTGRWFAHPLIASGWVVDSDQVNRRCGDIGKCQRRILGRAGIIGNGHHIFAPHEIRSIEDKHEDPVLFVHRSGSSVLQLHLEGSAGGRFLRSLLRWFFLRLSSLPHPCETKQTPAANALCKHFLVFVIDKSLSFHSVRHRKSRHLTDQISHTQAPRTKFAKSRLEPYSHAHSESVYAADPSRSQASSCAGSFNCCPRRRGTAMKRQCSSGSAVISPHNFSNCATGKTSSCPFPQ